MDDMNETSGDRLSKVTFEMQVLQKLGVIEYQNKQFLDYQATCEAERTAQGVRILNNDNDIKGARKDLDHVMKTVEAIDKRTDTVESSINRFEASRKTLLWASAILFVAGCSIGSIIAFAINIWNNHRA